MASRLEAPARPEPSGLTPGTLYVVGTPIGNLEDMTLRALRVLRQADVVAAEDTRHTRALLTHYGISRPLVSYREQNRESSAPLLLARLDTGSVALVSDAGMPAIADPGAALIAEVIARGGRVEVVPGPNAALAALVCAGGRRPADRPLPVRRLPVPPARRPTSATTGFGDTSRDPRFLRGPAPRRRDPDGSPGGPGRPACGGLP